MVDTKICPICKQPFEMKVFWKRFCSTKCRVINHSLKEANKVIKKKTVLVLLAFMIFSSNVFAQPDFSKIADAIYKAEGGAKAKKPFGILSVPCEGYTDCRRICLNTIRNNYRRWQNAGNPGEYLEFLASRYAPIEAHPINKNWLPNVKKIMEAL